MCWLFFLEIGVGERRREKQLGGQAAMNAFNTYMVGQAEVLWVPGCSEAVLQTEYGFLGSRRGGLRKE